MIYSKKYENGLRLVVDKTEGLFSVSVGVIVGTGSINESKENNGISHFIEHTVFKGTEKRTAFNISDDTDCIGSQINAFTSKEITCYYVKSTKDHVDESAEILSDIFFNATFTKSEIDKEKGVIIEEINMCEDTPEDLCLDILAESYYGDEGLGRPILGSAENVRSFTKEDVIKYMDKYYTSDNVVISFAGNIDFENAQEITEKYFVNNFKRFKKDSEYKGNPSLKGNLFKKKDIEQAHLALCFPAIKSTDERSDALSIANMVFGGGMSSRLFQKIREELGLAYTVYSYPSAYRDSGVIEIYAGVTTNQRDSAAQAILNELELFREKGVVEKEFLRGKEQIKSSFIMGKESTVSLMILYGKYMLFTDKLFSIEEKIKSIEQVTIEEVNNVIKEFFDKNKIATATVGPENSPLKLN